MNNRAAYLNTDLELYIDNAELPIPKDDDVLIQIKYTGICGSDLHYFRDGRVGQNIIREPHILGHESSGVILQIGNDVKNLKVGDEVAVEPGVPCLSCQYCLTGNYSLCNSVKFMGAPPFAGTFQEIVSHKALFTHKLPEGVDMRIGALVEPFAVGYNAVSKINPAPGTHVLIIGAGPIGLTTMVVALAGGAEVTITDVDDFRLGIAKSLGANRTVNVRNESIETDCYDCAVDASGNVAAFPAILSGCRKGAKVAIVGMTSDILSFEVNLFIRKELTVCAVYRYANDFQPVLKLLASPEFKTEGIISNEFKFDEIVEAFKFTDDPQNDKMKVMIRY